MADLKTNIIGKDVKLYDNGDGTYSLATGDKSIGGIRLADLVANSMGSDGAQYVVGTGATVPNVANKVFIAIQVLEDAVFTALVGNLTGTLTGVTFAQGFIIYGRFTSLTLASGKVIAYKGV